MSITLNDVRKLIAELEFAQRNVEACEEDLALAKEKERRLREDVLPAMMQELQITKLVLEDGRGVTLKQEVYGAITQANRAAAFRWLEDHGHGGLIKTAVSLEFGRGSAVEVAALMESLEKLGYNNVALDAKVHAGTLKAWMKEQLKAGEEFPMELFSARPIWEVKIK